MGMLLLKMCTLIPKMGMENGLHDCSGGTLTITADACLARDLKYLATVKKSVYKKTWGVCELLSNTVQFVLLSFIKALNSILLSSQLRNTTREHIIATFGACDPDFKTLSH